MKKPNKSIAAPRPAPAPPAPPAPAVVPAPAPAMVVEPPVPQFSASGRPSTAGGRLAFQLWLLMFLLTIVLTLLHFLISSWVYRAR